MSFGKKSISSSTQQESKPSREESKMDYDGSDKRANSNSDKSETGKFENTSTTDESSSLDRTKVKSENLDKERGPRGPYSQMEAARVIRMKTILDSFPSDMKFIGYKDIEEYNRISYVECTCFEVAVYEDEYGIRHEYYSPEHPSDTRRPKMNVVYGTPCTPDFLADMVVNRWMIHTPNHWENIRMHIDKFTSSENGRNNWMKTGANLLKPLCDYFKERMLKVKSILIDKLVYFLYDNDENDSRGSRPIKEFLGDFKGSIQSDGYVVYKHLAQATRENVHLLCWAHVRAKFKYAEDISKDEDAAWFVEQIGKLYQIEAENILLHRTPEEIKLRRSKDDVTRILSSLNTRASKMIKNKHLHYGDLMDKALHYMLNGWDELLTYRQDGRYTIDNLVAERAIRPFTVNRKNSLFYSSEEGGGCGCHISNHNRDRQAAWT